MEEEDVNNEVWTLLKQRELRDIVRHHCIMMELKVVGEEEVLEGVVQGEVEDVVILRIINSLLHNFMVILYLKAIHYIRVSRDILPITTVIHHQ